MTSRDAVLRILNHEISGLKESIELSCLYNQPLDIISAQGAEMLHAAMYGTRCTGSGGSGWDTADKGESKFSSRVQSRKCKKCGSKVLFFLDQCVECGSIELHDYPRDSRFGISAKSHIEYIEKLKGYRLALLEPKTFAPDCREFVLRSWFIETKDEWLTTYAQCQLESPKSNHINFMPLSKDFYRSSPCLHLQATLTTEGATIEYFDPTNRVPETVPAEYSTGTIAEHFGAKKFGKERGITQRAD